MSEIKTVKNIAVLTSGGDAPGMNAALRAVVRTALFNEVNVFGVHRGYSGLIEDDLIEMNLRTVSDIIHRGGTILHTARSKEFETLQGRRQAAENLKKRDIDALVVLGGDGSFRGCLEFAKLGISCIGIPCTIDNDIACSEYTIGFDTAMNTAIEMVDKLRDTTSSHDRCSVVEVMGRSAGYIAINTGIAVGAVATLIPEIPIDFDKDVINRMLLTRAAGKRHFIIVVAEGAASAIDIAEKISARTGLTTRSTVLGHVQRGGAPSLMDRVTASRMGYKAVDLILGGAKNRIVCMQKNEITDYSIEEALSKTKTIDYELINIAKTISI